MGALWKWRPHDAALRRHRAWMSTEEAKGAYRQRMQLVEPVFGIIKEQQQGHRFLLRGLPNVAAEWSLLATSLQPAHSVEGTASRGYLDKALGSRGRILSLSGSAGGYHGPSRRPASTHRGSALSQRDQPESLSSNTTLHLKQALQTCPYGIRTATPRGSGAAPRDEAGPASRR